MISGIGATRASAASEIQIRRFAAEPAADMMLYCFPFAGGSASFYHPWTSLMPDGVVVRALHLPGRPESMDSPSFTSLPAMAGAAAAAISSDAGDTPFVLFGHSMGALVAFETTCELERSRRRMPRLLAVSGSSAPHVRSETPALHLLPDGEFTAAVGRLGGMPQQIVANTEIMELVLPALRSDFQMLHRYRFLQRPLLETPVSVFGGTEDPAAPQAALGAWAELTRAAAKVSTYPGGHFFLSAHMAEMLVELQADPAWPGRR